MNKATVDAAKSKLERAISAKDSLMLAERGENFEQTKCDAWQNLYYAHPNAKNAGKQLDRCLDAYIKHFGKASDAMINAINACHAAATEVISAKAQYEQAKAAKIASKATAAAARKAPPVILKDSAANTQVVAAVTEVGNGFKARIKQQLASQYRFVIEQWQKKCQENPGKTSPSTFWDHDAKSRSAYSFNNYMRSTLNLFLRTEPRPTSEWTNDPGPAWKIEQHRYFLRPEDEVAKIIDTHAEKQAEEAIQSFIHKMCAKLGSILDQKGDFSQVTVTGTLGQNTMHFGFVDGSSFDLKNDIIINRSCYGTLFNQYPTRFSNVKLCGPWTTSRPGDHGLASVSEAWMKRNFKADRTIRFGRPAPEPTNMKELVEQMPPVVRTMFDAINEAGDPASKVTV